jgi:hypothetical protein
MDMVGGVVIGIAVGVIAAGALLELIRGWVQMAVTMLLVTACAVPAVRFATVSGERDFCFVETVLSDAGERTMLVAHVPWRDNRPIAKLATMDEAIATAERIGCPLR